MNEDNQLNSYIIEPWDHLIETQSPDGSVHDQYVPPELEDLARQVMRHYDMSVSSMVLITAKPDKGGAIWKIDTDKGPRSIKVLHRTPNRSLFSIGAQQYLVEQGARVPALIPTMEGELYVNAGGKSWIVTDWIESLTPVSKIDLAGVQDLCRGLGEFHRLSRGYTPPFGAVKATRLYRWPGHYEKIMSKLAWFEDIAEIYSEYPSAHALISILPQIKSQASDYYMMFRDSAYERMIAMGEPHWGLAHQDYGWSNGQMGPGGVWIIDLDGVAYDIPIRDLRKLITSTMVDNGGWDINWVRGMVEAYNEGNPIDRETFELLWIDMAFPNEFYKHVKEVVYEPELFMPVELEQILNMIQTVESNKWDVLNEFRADMDKYPAGDYAPAEEAPIMLPVSLPGAAAAAVAQPAPSILPEREPAAVASLDLGDLVAAASASVPSTAGREGIEHGTAVAASRKIAAEPVPARTVPARTVPAQPLISRPAVATGTSRSRRRVARKRGVGRRARATGTSTRASRSGRTRGLSRSRLADRTGTRSRTGTANRRTRTKGRAGSRVNRNVSRPARQRTGTAGRLSGRTRRSASAGRVYRAKSVIPDNQSSQSSQSAQSRRRSRTP